MPGRWAFRLAVVAVAAAFLGGCGGESNLSAETSRQLQASIAEYETYLQRSSQKLLHWTETIGLKVKEGSVPRAQSRYAASKVPAGHIAPVAELPTELPGYRRIEEAIFKDESTAAMMPVARQLRLDVENLQREIESADLSPGQIVAGANRVLDEILEQQLPGKSESYSGTTLTAIAAQVEGIAAALRAVKPVLADANPELLARLEARLRKVYEKVGEYGTFAKAPEQSRPQEPGIAFVVYSEFSPETIREIAEPIEGLAGQMAQAEDELEG